MSKLNELMQALIEMPDIRDLRDEVEILLHCKELLLNQLPFKAGDKIRISKPIEVTNATAPGWVPYKHLLVEGNTGIVNRVYVTPNYMAYVVEFKDNCERTSHSFHLQADQLELVEEPPTTDHIEEVGQVLIDHIVGEDLVSAEDEHLLVWSGRAPYVLGNILIKFAKRAQHETR